MGSTNPIIRSGLPSKAGECVTDNGNWIIDAPFSPLLTARGVAAAGGDHGSGQDGIWSVEKLATELKMPGVIEIGLFHGLNGDEAATLGRMGTAQKPVAIYFGLENGEVDVLLAEKK